MTGDREVIVGDLLTGGWLAALFRRGRGCIICGQYSDVEGEHTQGDALNHAHLSGARRAARSGSIGFGCQ